MPVVPRNCHVGAEELQAKLPETHVYKAFNTIGSLHMNKEGASMLNRTEMVMLYCGADDRKELVEKFITATGWTPKHVGGIRYARNLEVGGSLSVVRGW